MKLLDMVVKEYIAVVERLLIDKPIEKFVGAHPNRIIVGREEFKTMLGQYAYMTFAAKTKAYNIMGFIIHDENNYTLPCKDIELKKTVRKVVINYDVYQEIKRLYETELNI
jgi:hypothetical protein